MLFNKWSVAMLRGPAEVEKKHALVYGEYMHGCVKIINPAGWCELKLVMMAFSQGNMAFVVLCERRNADRHRGKLYWVFGKIYKQNISDVHLLPQVKKQ